MTTRIKTPEQIEAKRKATRKRLLEDFEFYAPRALKIRTKDAKIVPFRLNRAQRRLLDAVIRQWQETGRIRVVILKARQLGFSTVVGAFLYWWISQHKEIVRAEARRLGNEGADQSRSRGTPCHKKK